MTPTNTPGDEDVAFADKAPSSGASGYGPTGELPNESVFTDEVGGPAKAAAAAAPATPAEPKPAPPQLKPLARATPVSDRTRPGEGTGARPRASASNPDLALEPQRAQRMRASSSSQNVAIPGSERLRARKTEETAHEPIEAGKVLGEWTVRESLGEEDGVRIFEVERNGRTAILREHPLPGAAADDLAGFAGRLAPFRHEDLETVHGSGRSKLGAWYIVDERRTLRAAVAEKGPFREAEAVGLVRSVARALAALNQRNIIHGDVSPRNVLLDPEGAVRLASPLRVRNAHAHLAAGPITGDARYAAPGVLDGQAPIAATDVFTLGLTFAYALSGKDPVAETDPIAAMVARASLPGTIPDLRALAKDASPGAQALYLRMAEKDPTRRPQPAELVQECDAILTQGKVPALLPARPKQSLPRPIVPAPLAILVAVLALVAAVGAAVWSLSITSEDPIAGYKLDVPVDGK